MKRIAAGCIAGAVVLFMVAALAGDDGWVDLMKNGDLSSWKEPVGAWKSVGEGIKLSDDGKMLVPPEGKAAVVNGDKGNTRDLYTRAEYGDVEVHVEFLISKKSNSGVYLMGRYEIQVYDSYGVEKDKYPGLECGGIYPRWIDEKNVGGRSPRVNASLPAGEWQTFDITFRAPRFDSAGKKIANAVFVKVLHNGKLVHENEELTGPTRAAMAESEAAAGPLRLQGDHGPVAYRNLRIRQLVADNRK